MQHTIDIIGHINLFIRQQFQHEMKVSINNKSIHKAVVTTQRQEMRKETTEF